MRYKAELEQAIKKELNLVDPLTGVTVSETGEFATIEEGDKRTVRRLSEYGKRLLRKGETWLVTGESLLEPQ
jgi:hypothetical protein